MGSGKKIGAGAGVFIGVLVVIFLIIVVFYGTEYEDARLARVQTNYYDDTNRLQVIIIPPKARIIVRLCPKHAYFIDEEPVKLQVLS